MEAMCYTFVIQLRETELFFKIGELPTASRGTLFAKFTHKAITQILVAMGSAKGKVVSMWQLVRCNL